MRDDLPLFGWAAVALALIALLFLALGVALGAEPAPTLSETQRLRAEVQKLKEELLQTSYQLATCDAQRRASALVQDRQALERDLLQGAPAGTTFNWDKLALQPPAPAPEPHP